MKSEGDESFSDKSKEDKGHEILEIPKESTKRVRTQVLVEKLLKSKSGSGPPTMTKLKSSVLDRVKSFLPEMKSANEQLKNANPSTISIETVEEDNEKSYVEMNVQIVSESDSDSDTEDKPEDTSSHNSSDSPSPNECILKPQLVIEVVLNDDPTQTITSS